MSIGSTRKNRTMSILSDRPFQVFVTLPIQQYCYQVHSLLIHEMKKAVSYSQDTKVSLFLINTVRCWASPRLKGFRLNFCHLFQARESTDRWLRGDSTRTTTCAPCASTMPTSLWRPTAATSSAVRSSFPADPAHTTASCFCLKFT